MRGLCNLSIRDTEFYSFDSKKNELQVTEGMTPRYDLLFSLLSSEENVFRIKVRAPLYRPWWFFLKCRKKPERKPQPQKEGNNGGWRWCWAKYGAELKVGHKRGLIMKLMTRWNYSLILGSVDSRKERFWWWIFTLIVRMLSDSFKLKRSLSVLSR